MSSSLADISSVSEVGQLNGHMCVTIAQMLPDAWEVALIRSAGTHGHAVVSYLIRHGLIPISGVVFHSAKRPPLAGPPTQRLPHQYCSNTINNRHSVSSHSYHQQQQIAVSDDFLSEDSDSGSEYKPPVTLDDLRREMIPVSRYPNHATQYYEKLNIRVDERLVNKSGFYHRMMHTTNHLTLHVADGDLLPHIPLDARPKVLTIKGTLIPNTHIPHAFFWGDRRISQSRWGDRFVEKIDMSSLHIHTLVPREFLHQCSVLRSLKMFSITNLESVGASFLANCPKLEKVELTPLTGLTSCDYSFMSGCAALRSLDLTPLSSLTTISGSFLSNCSGLRSLDITPLSKVTVVGNAFLSGCHKLEHMDLRPLVDIQRVGSDFMSKCVALISIDIHPLPPAAPTNTSTVTKDDVTDVETINSSVPSPPPATLASHGYRWNDTALQYECVFYSSPRAFDKCTSLVAGMLPPPPTTDTNDTTTTNTTIASLSIPSGLLNHCPKLTNDILGLEVFHGAAHISKNFLVGCKGLTSTLDLSPLSTVTSIGSAFLFQCSSLLYIDLTPLSKVVSIGPFFLHSCIKIKSIDLSPLGGLERLPTEFMGGCVSLTAIDLSPLVNLSRIDVAVFGGCTKLREVIFGSLPKLQRIDRLFLRGCGSLDTLDLAPLAGVALIRKQFLVRSACLHTIDRTQLSKVATYPNFFGHIHTSPLPAVVRSRLTTTEDRAAHIQAIMTLQAQKAPAHH